MTYTKTDELDALRGAFNEGYDKGFYDAQDIDKPGDVHRAWDESETRQNTLESASLSAPNAELPAVRSTAWLDGQTLLTREAITQRIAAELDNAYAKHGRDQWGRHEFYAILREEVDELWDGIKRDDPQADTIEEALQVAAMVFRYLETGDRYRQPSNDKHEEAID